MKKTIATKSGGHDVTLSAAEEDHVRARWAASEQEYAAQEAEKETKESRLRSGLTKMTALLSALEREALMERLGLD